MYDLLSLIKGVDFEYMYSNTRKQCHYLIFYLVVNSFIATQNELFCVIDRQNVLGEAYLHFFQQNSYYFYVISFFAIRLALTTYTCSSVFNEKLVKKLRTYRNVL